MQVIWDHGTANAAEVGQALAETHPLAETTVHTVLANLRKKGYLEPVPTVERALRFAPAVPREQVAQSTLWRVIGEFFAGSPKRLMAHLVQDEQLDDTELAEIRNLLRRNPKKERKAK